MIICLTQPLLGAVIRNKLNIISTIIHQNKTNSVIVTKHKFVKCRIHRIVQHKILFTLNSYSNALTLHLIIFSKETQRIE